jgi:hypothetical protein
LAHLRGQYEALGAAETAAPPSNNMDFWIPLSATPIHPEGIYI